MKIGMFDSGIGGLSTLRNLLCMRHDLEVFYWADDAHAPYGSKSDEYVKDRSKAIVKIFESMGIELVVVACNTATAMAIEDLRASFPHMTLVGVEPYVNVINHIPWQKEHRAVILTTPLTGQSERFCRLRERLDPDNKLDHFSCPTMAKLVEHAFWHKDTQLAQKIQLELAPIKDRNYQYVILGCTHYPLVGHYIQQALGAEVISPCSAISKRVLSLLKLESLPAGTQSVKFMFARSSKGEQFSPMEFSCNGPWPEL
ncbi:glutamate racemase [Bacteriovorax sp. BSW11_IV]|uniref:glutamate racemase n=1 Tax=Bacteriovorax sp. BSW11_IV TaxID=1353529 RepID=UPI00038A06B3|nr:glutamate racemase [Bacteriovorax sp. BSW11_IV]EQC49475.1 glutamate racemase [Bacteriovorax sp. BSW11_IV]